jgi:hypothetical protein
LEAFLEKNPFASKPFEIPCEKINNNNIIIINIKININIYENNNIN